MTIKLSQLKIVQLWPKNKRTLCHLFFLLRRLVIWFPMESNYFWNQIFIIMRLQFHEIYLPRTFIIAQMFECFKTYFIKLSICKKIRIRFQKNILPHCVILVSTLMERFIRRKYLSFCGSKDRRGKAKTR